MTHSEALQAAQRYAGAGLEVVVRLSRGEEGLEIATLSVTGASAAIAAVNADLGKTMPRLNLPDAATLLIT